MEIQLDTECALIEAVLFMEMDPIDMGTISRVCGFSHDVVAQCLEQIQEKLKQPSSGIELVQIGDGWSLSPKRALWEGLRDRYGRRNESRLSRAALETLSIIAYSQPITRAEIESIRGVSADNMIRLLVERNLIREVGKKEAPGKPIQYGTSKEFLEFFRLKSIADLPKMNEPDTERFELNEG